MNGVDSNGGAQVAVAPAHFVASDSTSVVAAAAGDGESGVAEANSSDDDEDREELEREVDALMADKVYHDFVDNVAKNKEIADEDDDGDFENLGETVAASAAAGDADDEDDASSEASTLTDPDEYEDAVEDVGVEVKIPKEALLEAEKRFPPFWRLKHALKNESMTEYKSDEDPDFEANEDEEQVESPTTKAATTTEEQANKDQEQMNAAAAEWVGHRDVDGGAGGDGHQDEELNSSTSEDEDDEASMKAEVDTLMDESSRPIQDDVVDGLVEMVEYMTLPPSAATAADGEGCQAAADDDEEHMEEMEEEGDQPGGQSILVDGYVSGEDPDFKPDPELLQRRASVSSSSSATSSSDEEENYHQQLQEEGTVERME